MPAYIVGQIDIRDRDMYSKYEAGFMEIFNAHDGELLAADDNSEHVEGSPACTRMVIARFPDKDAVKRWYDSAEYQALAEYRWKASDGVVSIVEGWA